MSTVITKKELKSVVRETVKETMSSELMKMRAFWMPTVSSGEQKDIEKLYKNPSRKIKKTRKINI